MSSLVPLLLVPHIIRQIGLTEFGVLAIASAFAAYGAIFVQYAFNLTGPQHLASNRDQSRASVIGDIATAKILLFIFVCLVILLAQPGLTLVGWQPTRAQLIILLAVPLGAALHSGWYLQSVGKLADASVVAIIGSVLTLAVGFTMIGRSQNNSEMAAVSLVIGPLVGGVGTAFVAARNAKRLGELRFAWHSPRWALKDGWPLFASQFTASLYSASGPIVIGLLSSSAQAGAYGAVERIANAFIGACLLTHSAAYPRLAHLYITDRKAYLLVLAWVVSVYLIGVSGLIVIAIFQYDSLVTFVLGNSQEGSGPLILAAMCWMLLGVFGSALTGYWTVSGRGHLLLPLTLKILAVAFLLGLPGVLFLGGWAWLAALCVSQIPILVALWKAFRNETLFVRAQR